MQTPAATDKAARLNERTGRTASKAVRRQQLIEATIDSIAKYGISGTTMTTVTGLAGLSVGIVNFHFESKEKLFEETLRFLAEEHRELWVKSIEKVGLASDEKLMAIVDAEFHPQTCNRKKLTVWTAFYGEAGYRKSYRNIMTSIDTERWETIIGLCQDLIDASGQTDLEAQHIADTLEGLFDGFCLNILVYPGEFTRENAKQRTASYLAMVFPGYFNPPASCSSQVDT
ncbi:TetR family transcriptional regulator C-terminal domain-containing protein [Roseovarius sp.]|uniref:TetR family transcriptional regulator C-terminal domain-containing protein n=1 Tax=Roseovarius sp. TaxID=1486281 RepID=UPI003D0E3092